MALANIAYMQLKKTQPRELGCEYIADISKAWGRKIEPMNVILNPELNRDGVHDGALEIAYTLYLIARDLYRAAGSSQYVAVCDSYLDNRLRIHTHPDYLRMKNILGDW